MDLRPIPPSTVTLRGNDAEQVADSQLILASLLVYSFLQESARTGMRFSEQRFPC